MDRIFIQICGKYHVIHFGVKCKIKYNHLNIRIQQKLMHLHHCTE